MGAAASSYTLSAQSLAIWRGDRCLCRDLSFELHDGQALHVQGPNGSGKTSLIRALTGLGRSDAGEVHWQGESLRHCGATYHTALAYLGHSNGVKLGLSPRENLTAVRALIPAPATFDTGRVLVQAGLSEHADMPCSTLSMGQRRRTALARLLLTRVPLWFLDEPLAGLDAVGVLLVNQMVRTHLAAGGLAVFATHQDLELAPFSVQTLKLGTSA